MFEELLKSFKRRYNFYKYEYEEANYLLEENLRIRRKEEITSAFASFIEGIEMTANWILSEKKSRELEEEIEKIIEDSEFVSYQTLTGIRILF